MKAEELRRMLIQISEFFYQEKISEGMSLFPEAVQALMQEERFLPLLTPLMDAVEARDYVQAADICYFEMAQTIVPL